MTRVQRLRVRIVIGITAGLWVATAIFAPMAGADLKVLIPMLVISALILCLWFGLIRPVRQPGPSESQDEE